ncbi:MAG: 30S ribosomal protein S18 [Mycoplasmataceae bacterium]|jgi:small subunit ribosomal protein S18|nr:30S ribosomal protein S18 [Mycoplasmataceae bacterium]
MITNREHKDNKDGKQPFKKRNFIFKKKTCQLCANGTNWIDYKNVELLTRYISHTGKILPRRVTGACTKHQRMVANAIKKARIVALLPFVKE